MIVEVTGPGEATVLELKHLRQLFDAGALPIPGDGTIEDIFGNARWFMYHRSDSVGTGYALNWKCLALDTPLPTPTGWTTMGSVKSGDNLLDEKGKPCKVLSVSPVQINHKCYRITLDDGSSIVADEDHLWPVHRHLKKCWNNGAIKLRKTKELKADKYLFPVNGALDLPNIDLPIDPYILGVWLGDGKSAGGGYFCSPNDYEDMSANLRTCGAVLLPVQIRKNVCEQTISGLITTLKACGLSGNKHIPKEYLRASKSQRLALLQGLMDTDGSAGGNGGRQCSFTTSNPRMAGEFSELVRSLGFKAKRCVRNRVLQYGGGTSICEPAFQYWFTAHADMPVFRLPRKQALVNSDARRKLRIWHRIVAIDEIDSVPVKCIAVDSTSKLYLAGEAMVPTHNTNMDNKLAVMNQLRDSLTLGMVEVRSIQCALEIQSLVQDGFVIEPAVSTSKDDRVFGTAFAHRAWTDWVRPSMISANETWERETQREAAMEDGAHDTMVSHIVSDFFQGKEQDREDKAIEDMWK